MIVLDTNVASELMRAAPADRVLRWVSQQAATEVCTTAVTLAEVRYGIGRLPPGRRRKLLWAAWDDVVAAFVDRILPFDAAAAGHYADIVVGREHAGAPISGFDAQIAAICRTQHIVLATRNTADFDHLDLQLANPWATNT